MFSTALIAVPLYILIQCSRTTPDPLISLPALWLLSDVSLIGCDPLICGAPKAAPLRHRYSHPPVNESTLQDRFIAEGGHIVGPNETPCWHQVYCWAEPEGAVRERGRCELECGGITRERFRRSTSRRSFRWRIYISSAHLPQLAHAFRNEFVYVHRMTVCTWNILISCVEVRTRSIEHTKDIVMEIKSIDLLCKSTPNFLKARQILFVTSILYNRYSLWFVISVIILTLIVTLISRHDHDLWLSISS